MINRLVHVKGTLNMEELVIKIKEYFEDDLKAVVGIGVNDFKVNEADFESLLISFIITLMKGRKILIRMEDFNGKT